MTIRIIAARTVHGQADLRRPALELDCAADDIALQMTRWLSHLRAERRLSPKTLEAYAPRRPPVPRVSQPALGRAG